MQEQKKTSTARRYTREQKDQAVRLPAFVADFVGRQLGNIEDRPEAFLFPAPRGRPLRYPNTRTAIWDRARERASDDPAEITPHDLRHTCASLMRAAGADVKAIQQQLGHRNASVTMNTTHTFSKVTSQKSWTVSTPIPRSNRVLSASWVMSLTFLGKAKTPAEQGFLVLRG